jgi:hypothetical protein
MFLFRITENAKISPAIVCQMKLKGFHTTTLVMKNRGTTLPELATLAYAPRSDSFHIGRDFPYSQPIHFGTIAPRPSDTFTTTEKEPRTVNTTTHAQRKTKTIPRTRKPDDMTLAEWQIALRRQYGRDAQYTLKNLDQEPVFSDFEVTNPDSRSTYRVAIRGSQPGDNFCACPDYAINTLGTCKHIEFVLGKLENK